MRKEVEDKVEFLRNHSDDIILLAISCATPGEFEKRLREIKSPHIKIWPNEVESLYYGIRRIAAGKSLRNASFREGILINFVGGVSRIRDISPIPYPRRIPRVGYEVRQMRRKLSLVEDYVRAVIHLHLESSKNRKEKTKRRREVCRGALISREELDRFLDGESCVDIESFLPVLEEINPEKLMEDCIRRHLHYDPDPRYTELSSLFSDVPARDAVTYHLALKMEVCKEVLGIERDGAKIASLVADKLRLPVYFVKKAERGRKRPSMVRVTVKRFKIPVDLDFPLDLPPEPVCTIDDVMHTGSTKDVVIKCVYDVGAELRGVYALAATRAAKRRIEKLVNSYYGDVPVEALYIFG